MATIGTVIVTLVRSSKSGSHKTALKEDVEHSTTLDPMEIDDLRRANSDWFTPELWEAIRDGAWTAFPSGRATYGQFMHVVAGVLAETGASTSNDAGRALTLEMGHLVDRVVVEALERRQQQPEDTPSSREQQTSGYVGNHDEDDDDESLPLPFFFAALSLALTSTVSQRIEALYQVMLQPQPLPDDNQGKKSVATGVDAADMITHLQQTCQLVPEAQIVETASKIPYQTYRVGSGHELADRARRGYGGKKGSPGVTLEPEGDVTLEDFCAMLTSRTVCAWGECYVKRRGRMVTSDRA